MLQVKVHFLTPEDLSYLFLQVKLEVIKSVGEEGLALKAPLLLQPLAKSELQVPLCPSILHLPSLFRSDSRSSPEPKRAICPGGGDARAGPGGGPRVVHQLAQRLQLTARRSCAAWDSPGSSLVLLLWWWWRVRQEDWRGWRCAPTFTEGYLPRSSPPLLVQISCAVKRAWFCAPGFNGLCLFGYGLIVITVMTSGELRLNKHRRTSPSSRSSCWKHENFVIRAVTNPTELFFLSSWDVIFLYYIFIPYIFHIWVHIFVLEMVPKCTANPLAPCFLALLRHF